RLKRRAASDVQVATAIGERPLAISLCDVQRNRRTGTVQVLDSTLTALAERTVEDLRGPGNELNRPDINVKLLVIKRRGTAHRAPPPSLSARRTQQLPRIEHEHEHEHEHDSAPSDHLPAGSCT